MQVQGCYHKHVYTQPVHQRLRTLFVFSPHRTLRLRIRDVLYFTSMHAVRFRPTYKASCSVVGLYDAVQIRSSLRTQPVHHRHAVLAGSADDHDHRNHRTLGVRSRSVSRLLRPDLRQHVHRNFYHHAHEHRPIRRCLVARRLQQVSIRTPHTHTNNLLYSS